MTQNGKPEWGGLDPYEIKKPLREKMREQMRDAMGPDGGVVVTDLDLVIRHYGDISGAGWEGAFRLIEQKYVGAKSHGGQNRTFTLMHNLLREADPDCLQYKGFYRVEYGDVEWEDYSWVTVKRLYEFGGDRKMHVIDFIGWCDDPKATL